MVIQLIRFLTQINETLIKNQDPQDQTENDETPRANYSNENNSENTETKQNSAISNFMLQILAGDEITGGINSWKIK